MKYSTIAYKFDVFAQFLEEDMNELAKNYDADRDRDMMDSLHAEARHARMVAMGYWEKGRREGEDKDDS